jgi:hypothetical protein
LNVPVEFLVSDEIEDLLKLLGCEVWDTVLEKGEEIEAV